MCEFPQQSLIEIDNDRKYLCCKLLFPLQNGG